MTPVVLVERDDPDIRIPREIDTFRTVGIQCPCRDVYPVCEFCDVIDGREPETVDALFPIAYDTYVVPIGDHETDVHLHGIRVLELVHDQIVHRIHGPGALIGIQYTEREHRNETERHPVIGYGPADEFVVDVIDEVEQAFPVPVDDRLEQTVIIFPGAFGLTLDLRDVCTECAIDVGTVVRKTVMDLGI